MDRVEEIVSGKEIEENVEKGKSFDRIKLLQMKNESRKNSQKKWNASRKRTETIVNKMNNEIKEIKEEMESKDASELTAEQMTLIDTKADRLAQAEVVLKAYKGEEIPAEYVGERAIQLKKEMYGVLFPLVEIEELYDKFLPESEKSNENIFEEEKEVENPIEFPGDITGNDFSNETEDNSIDLEKVELENSEEIATDIEKSLEEEKEEKLNYDEFNGLNNGEGIDINAIDEVIQEKVNEIDPDEIEENQTTVENNDVFEEEAIREVPEIAPERIGFYENSKEEKQNEEPLDLKLNILEEVENFKYEIDSNESAELREWKEKISKIQEEMASATNEEIEERDRAREKEDEYRRIRIERATDIENAKLASDEELVQAAKEVYEKLSTKTDAKRKSADGFRNKQADIQNEIDNYERQTEEELQKIYEDTEKQKEVFASMIDTGTVEVGIEEKVR